MTDIPAAPRRPWIVTLLTALLVLLTVTPAVTAAAASPTAATAATRAAHSASAPAATDPGTPPDTLELTLAPVGNGIVRPGEALAVSVTVSNETALNAPAAEVLLELGPTALADRPALSAWMSGDDTGQQLAVAGTAIAEAVDTGDRGVTGIMVAADDPLLVGRAPGVYPLRATATSMSGTMVATSVMVVPDDTAGAGVGVVVPITAPPLGDGLLSSGELLALTAPDGELTAQLEAVTGTNAILAIDPAIAAAVRALGTAAPVGATAWLQRLAELPNERFALQFGDADIAAQLNAGLPAPLTPTTLQPYLNAAAFIPDAAAPTPTPTPTPSPSPSASPSFTQQAPAGAAPAPEATATATATPTATPTPSPTPTTPPGDPVYPTLEQLLSVDATREGVYWPFTGTANAAVVATLGGLATEQQAPVTLVASGTTAQGADSATVPAHASADAASVLVYDSQISEALQQASLLDDSAIRGAALTEATAHLVFAVRESGGRPLLVTLDRADGRSRLGLTTALSTVETAPGVAPAGLEVLLAGEPTAVTIADAEPDQARTAAVTELRADEARLSDFGTILDDPAVLTAPERASMLQLLGGAWLADAEAWQAAVSSHRQSTTETLASVSIPQLTDINLVGQKVPLRIWVRNGLPWPVNVELIAQPGDARLLVQRETPVRAEPDSNARVQIPVEAHVGNGEVDLRFELLSPSGVPIGAAQTATVMVRADWEVIGIAALAIVVGGLLVIGLVRTVGRRRRARADDAMLATQSDEAVKPGEDGER